MRGWVERGQAPNEVIASRVERGLVVRTRDWLGGTCSNVDSGAMHRGYFGDTVMWYVNRKSLKNSLSTVYTNVC